MIGKRKGAWMAAALAFLLVLTACGQSKDQGASGGEGNAAANTADPVSTEPVTLKLFNHSAGIVNDADFQQLVLKPVQAKYPNINIELVKGKLDEMISSGDVPDLIAAGNIYINDLKELGVVSDLNDLVTKYKTDLSKVDPGALDFLKQLGPKGELYGIPYSLNYGMLVYNKDIFDKFGVPYPQDSMTWKQVTELARRVTREADGTQYRGLDPDGAQPLVRQYSLQPYDPKTGKSTLLTNEGFQKVLGVLQQIYDIPGMVGSNNKYLFGIDGFLKDRTTAMYAYWLTNFTSRILDVQNAGNDFNWDVTTYPAFDDKPGFSKAYDFHVMMITPTSKHRDAAYRVIETMVSEEAQKAMNKSGSRLTILSDTSLREQFASDTKVYEGKNLKGVFKSKPAPASPPSKYDVQIYNFVGDALKDIVTKHVDINTALRTADEKANAYIQETESQK